MRFNLDWLSEWTNPDITSDKLAEQLSLYGLEVDSYEPVAGDFNGIVVGEVLDIAPHPDAKKLQICQVNVGEDSALTIVCGASNVRIGMKVPTALVGAKLKADFEIKQAKLRGIDSFGMLCSASEIGLAQSSDGLLELAADAPVGQDIREYLSLNDKVIEVDITPNRGDCLSIAGIAREVAVINRADYNAVEIKPVIPSHQQSFPVEIIDKKDCPHYVGRVIKNINMDITSPVWLQERLRRCGLRSIDPIVDITNYVMLELGQPLHAFDLNTLDEKIIVRKADAGENLKMLDGQEIELQADTLLITDKNKPLAIAGIMGGADSGVSEDTKHIFLESAFFTPHLIAGKSRKYGLHTDSSHRFERGVDPELQIKAVERASELILSITGGEAGPIIENTANEFLPQNKVIKLRHARVTRVLGVEIAAQEIEDILTRLGMSLEKTVDQDVSWEVQAPSYRFDIAIEEDLIEEVGRIYGYDNIPTENLLAELVPYVRSEASLTKTKCASVLQARDYQEAITYTFTSSHHQQLLDPGCPGQKLLNPISDNLSVMRTNLWPGLVEAMSHNQRHQEDRVRLFEIGMVFREEDAVLKQIPSLGGIISGASKAKQWGVNHQQADFYDIKGDVMAILSLTGDIDSFEFKAESHPALHPGQSAKIYKNQTPMGWVGALHPGILPKLDLTGSVFVFELNFQELEAAEIPKFAKLSKYPEIRRDLALVMDEAVTASSVMNAIKSQCGELLVNLALFDVYRGTGVPEGKKSLALGLAFQHLERTLVEDEVNTLIDATIKKLKMEFDAILRE